MQEFGAKINLDARTATEQLRKFANQSTIASRTLKEFQAETKKTTQGSDNLFRGYINSSKRAAIQTENSIKKIHELRIAYSKLTDEQKSVIDSADRLNRKYDESARKEHVLLQTRRELRQVVAAGLKTQREANAIYDREAIAITKSTRAYREKQAELKRASELNRAQTQRINELNAKYNKEVDIKRKVMQVTKELNLLKRKGLIDSKKHASLLARETAAIKAQHAHIVRLTSAQHQLAKAARLVSIFSRVLLGLYAAARITTFIKDVEETAEKIGLLTQKLEFLTGDSGAYAKLFQMTQEVGIAMEAANKIVTRFAIVTNKVYDIETLNEWTSTIIKSARATGTSTQEMSGALIQITQAMSAGRLMGDEYRSVTENLPLFTVALRDLFKDSTLSLKELSSQGLLTNKVLIQGFEKLKEIVAEFPDTTDTVGASIDRISSAWDNFLSKVSNTNIVKNVLNEISAALNDFSRLMDTIELDSNTEEMKTAVDGLRQAQDDEILGKKKIEQLEKDSLNANFIMLAIIDKRIEKEKRLLGLAIAKKKISAEEIRTLLGIDDKSLKKDKLDSDVKQVELETRANKELLKTLKLIESIESGKTIATVKKRSELKRRELDASQIGFGPEGTNVPGEQYFDLSDKINENEKDKIAKIEKTNLDGALRLQALKTDFDIEDIELELAHNKKILSIEKRAADNLLDVRSAAQARIIALNDSIPENDNIGISAEKAKELVDALDAKRLHDINKELVDVGANIIKIGMAADQSRLSLELKEEQRKPRSKFEGVSEAESAIGFQQLAMDKVKLTEKYNEKIRETNLLIEQGQSKNTEAGDALVATQELTLESLQKEYDTRINTLDIDYQETFDNNYIANKEATDAIIELWDGVADSIIGGIGDAVAVAITDQKSFADALAATVKAVTKTIISSMVEIGIRRLIDFTTSESMQSAQLATSTATALTTAAVWTKAAAAVNAATFGAAAAAGAVEIMKIAAVAEIAFAPKAHSGLDRNPEEGTMLLRRDEMVLDPGTSAKVRSNIDGATTGGEFGDGVNPPLIVQIDAQDAESFVERVGSPDVMNEIWDRFNEMMNERGRSFR